MFMWTWKRCVYSYYFECNVLKISINFNCSIVSFRISIALLILSEDLPMDLSWMLKFSTMTVFLAISPFISFMFLGASIVGTYMLMNINPLFLCWFLYHCIVSFFIVLYGLCFKVCLSGMSIVPPAFLLFPLEWNIVFYPLIFNLWLSFCPRIGSLGGTTLWSSFLKNPICVFWLERLVHWHLR